MKVYICTYMTFPKMKNGNLKINSFRKVFKKRKSAIDSIRKWKSRLPEELKQTAITLFDEAEYFGG